MKKLRVNVYSLGLSYKMMDKIVEKKTWTHILLVYQFKCTLNHVFTDRFIFHDALFLGFI